MQTKPIGADILISQKSEFWELPILRDIDPLVEAINLRFSKRRPVTENSAGALIYTDAWYFLGFQFLYASLKDILPVVVADLGMTAEQRRWCESRMAVITPEPVISKSVTGWQNWNKPFYIEQSPFRYTLYLDSDCFVVGNLNPVFDWMKHDPVITRHWRGENYILPNSEELYEVLPVKNRLAQADSINNGVLGIDLERDRELLEAWKRITYLAKDDQKIRKLINWWDEGAFHWAVQAVGQSDKVLNFPQWNRKAVVRAKNGVDAVGKLKVRENDVILHFTGSPKPHVHFALTDIPFPVKFWHLWSDQWPAKRRPAFWLNPKNAQKYPHMYENFKKILLATM